MPSQRIPTYFRQYAGSGKSYQEVFLIHSAIDDCLRLIQARRRGQVTYAPLLPRPHSMIVLGTATGLVLSHIYERIGIRPYGCEKSAWAWGKIPPAFRRRIARMDMRDYVSVCPRVDLMFSNSLMYLESDDVLPFLCLAAIKTTYFHFHGSFWGDSCPDPFRKTLKPLRWWKEQFYEAGFAPLLHRSGRESYLWERQRKISGPVLTQLS